MLELYRRALRARRQHLTGAGAGLEWLPSDDGVLAFRRGDVVCVVNLSPEPVAARRAGHRCSSPARTRRGLLAPDAAAWIHATPWGLRPTPIAARRAAHTRRHGTPQNSPTQPLTAKEHQR